jgi:heme oxygenase
MISDEPGLAARLRIATADLHRQAERSGIIRDLLTGRANRTGLGLLLRNLLPVYEALEAGLEAHRREVLLAGLTRPELYRAASLRQDIARCDDAFDILPAGAAYAERVTQAAEGDGAELVAFAYVRYVGDLSGGPILSRLIGGSLDMPPPAFYQFPDIADRSAFRDAYRGAIDEAGTRMAEPARVVRAAQDAFRLDIGLSIAVARCSKRVSD